jgi:hypothetical protein
VLSLIHTHYNSLQHTLSLPSLLYLHWLSPGNGFQCYNSLQHTLSLSSLLYVHWLLYGRQLTTNQFVLATSPLRLMTSNFFFQLNTRGRSPDLSPSLTRGWVCRLQLLPVLASAVILGSESRGTHDHILLSQIRDSPNSSSVVSSHSCRTDRIENASQLPHCYLLRICCGHYLPTAVV